MSVITNVSNVARKLMTEFKTLTEYEALQIACKMESTEAFAIAFGVDRHLDQDYSKDTALELIANAMTKD